MATYAIIDVSNLFHRCKHAIMGDAATKAGMAIHICLESLKMIKTKFGTDHVVAALDKSSWRKEIYPEYKANRAVKDALKTKAEREEDQLYFESMTVLIDFLREKTNVSVLESPGCEADDFIARWIQLHPKDHHVILSGDTDFYQLLADNVTIYDGVKRWTINNKQILDENGKQASKKKTKKQTITTHTGSKKEKKITETILLEAPDPEYELFKKIIRGDSTDNIFPAFPGVRENGSKTKPGIREAYNDRHGQGYDWTMFMQTEWEDHTGENVKVLDSYKFNKRLIDLTQQPDDIIKLMDDKIVEVCGRQPKSAVGIHLLKFCKAMNLVKISNNPNDYATILQAYYKPGA